jgi:hypothetical protein
MASRNETRQPKTSHHLETTNATQPSSHPTPNPPPLLVPCSGTERACSWKPRAFFLGSRSSPVAGAPGRRLVGGGVFRFDVPVSMGYISARG